MSRYFSTPAQRRAATAILNLYDMQGFYAMNGIRAKCITGMGRIIGVGAVSHDDDGVWLNCIAVHPDRQRLGIGRAIVEWLLLRCPRGHPVWLETMPDNFAFYEGLGFTCMDIEAARTLYGYDPRTHPETTIMRRNN
jgi:ribosomal protein S18 acetylase RimI-like enzyme